MLILCCLWSFNEVRAQDVHFSQIDVNPTLFDPAYSGFFDGQGRLGLNYRNQWASISEPFQTFAITAEMSILRSKRQRYGINLGLFAYHDLAGALNYGTTAADIILSVHKALSSRGHNLISLAASLGVGQFGFDDSRTDMTIHETFDINRSTFFNLGLGVAYFHQFHDDLYIKFGLSGQHLNEPNISYLGLDDTYLIRKFNGYIRSEWRCTDNVALLPVAALQLQRKYSELIYGIDLKWYYDESFDHQTSFIGGVLFRQSDAIIFDLGIDYRSFTFAFTYDANISKLASASHTIGAFELGIVYRINPASHNRRKAIACPVF